MSADEDRNTVRIGIGLVAVMAVAAGGYWWWQRAPQAAPAPVAVEIPAGEAPVMTVDPDAIQNPLAPAAPVTDVAATTPPHADAAAAAAIMQVFGSAVGEWLVTDQFARRLVATVDNLGRPASVEKIRPLRPPAEPFAVERETIDAVAGTERIAMADANHARYDSLVAMVAGSDAAMAAETYRRLYPQLQAAYEELGYPGRYFNDRLVAVIDHLLATPERDGPLLLEQPKVLYRFADPELESRSPGQKLLLRIGVEHARVVKQKLRQFRAHIATQAAENNNRE